MRRLAACALMLLAVWQAGPGVARTLPLADRLVALNDDAGEQMLLRAQAREAYWSLSVQFVTQETQSYCGVASIVMVLNALDLPAPATPPYAPYRVFTQDNVFDARTEAVVPQADILRHGMTLDQLGQLLGALGAHAQVVHAADTSLDAFRATAADRLARKDAFVVVNYLRSALGQERGGHISPLAAYDSASDRFLVLDVARYKYPPAWVKAADLFAAMNTTDADNDNRSRGFVLIDRRS